jgi:hypothetical protein
MSRSSHMKEAQGSDGEIVKAPPTRDCCKGNPYMVNKDVFNQSAIGFPSCWFGPMRSCVCVWGK